MFKPSIVIDIDETLISNKLYDINLIHNWFNSDPENFNIILDNNPELKNIDIQTMKVVPEPDKLYLTHFIFDNNLYIIMMRPFLKEFILSVNTYFNVYVYSLGTFSYIKYITEAIIKLIGFNPFICIMSNPDSDIREYIKKISKLDLDFSNILIIDDRIDVWVSDSHRLYQISKYSQPYVYNPNYRRKFELSEFLNQTNSNQNPKSSTDPASTDPASTDPASTEPTPTEQIQPKYLLSSDTELKKLILALNAYFCKYPNQIFNIYIFRSIIREIEED